ncbi:NTP transferase domain-containing protein [uncultured Ruminococcus sp.]|uniref:NTP transferase domain-containing protein n=1 Tax=uncultured Ruminococcus sp. TaxID=165186 RepID=UPI0025F0C757|nr:NTP transferase domain-containing protein [uncultured Ruminococcus sp.]
MNNIYSDILKVIIENKCNNQRDIVKLSNYSLGKVNEAVSYFKINDYINDNFELKEKTYNLLENSRPNNAVILAAGYGMRMIPINNEIPKGLIEINNEPLIERIIRQLHDIGISNIYVVVGFMKEAYEYLIDSFNVELIYNPQYSICNNLYSLYCAEKYIDKTYIVPCDIWLRNNPFSKFELNSWYMVTDELSEKNDFKVNKKRRLSLASGNEAGNFAIGLSYVDSDDSKYLRDKLSEYSKNSKYNSSFWEECFVEKNQFLLPSKLVSMLSAYEINTIEDLREIDENSASLNSEVIKCASKALNVPDNEIKDIQALKKGMTNRSFIFTCLDKKYIFRIPGKGTDSLINRNEEYSVYEVIRNLNICDDIVYINPNNGYKITKYIENCRNCDPLNWSDVKSCMNKLKSFHNMGLQVNHTFDIFKNIEYYEKLRNCDSVYRDYEKTKENVFKLREFIGEHKAKFVLTHIDAVPDNFIINGNDIRLIDWEYAGMQDPHVDLAMFSIYSFYSKDQIDRLIDIYFDNGCDRTTRIKIYCYVAACGLLWSNWCEYKLSLGVEFGEYSIRQYRYAKEFYKIAVDEMRKLDE